MASTSAVVPYPVSSLKPFEGAPPPGTHQFPAPSGLLPLDQYRLQLYNYAMVERLRFSNFTPYNNQIPFCSNYPYNPRLALQMSLFHNRVFQPEEPKPQHSYIGLIAMAILSSPEGKLVLSDIYQYILDNYPYFRSRGPGWRNSIRHNLSLNDCFIKAGRSANGKGHYWAVHPANVDDFKKGDFRRRKAQRKVRKHMGLAVDEEGEDSPSPPPVPMSPPPPRVPLPGLCPWPTAPTLGLTNAALFPPIPSLARKRQFDVASLLAPDEDKDCGKIARRFDENYNSSGEEVEAEEDIDVVSEDLSMGNSRRQEKSEDGRQPSEAHSPLMQPSHSSQQRSPVSPSVTQDSRNSPPLPLWVRQQGAVIHPTAMFPPATLSFMEQQQQIVNRFYEQRMAQQRRYFQPTDDMSPVNLKNEDS